MSGAYQRYDGYTNPDGTIHVDVITNDDNDDGLPDEDTVEWTLRCPDRAAFDKRVGRSRTGCSGIAVTVTLDGVRV